MKVRFYGKLADLFGSEREVGIRTPCTVAELRDRLIVGFPQAADALHERRVRACIGNAIAQDSDVVREGGMVEFLAPVSGG